MRGISQLVAVAILLIVVIVGGVLIYHYMTTALHSANTISLTGVVTAYSNNPIPTSTGYKYGYTVTLTINNQYGQTLYIRQLNLTLYGANGPIGTLPVINLDISKGQPETLKYNYTVAIPGTTETFQVIMHQTSNVVPTGAPTKFTFELISPVPLTAVTPSVQLISPDGHTKTVSVQSPISVSG